MQVASILCSLDLGLCSQLYLCKGWNIPIVLDLETNPFSPFFFFFSFFSFLFFFFFFVLFCSLLFVCAHVWGCVSVKSYNIKNLGHFGLFFVCLFGWLVVVVVVVVFFFVFFLTHSCTKFCKGKGFDVPNFAKVKDLLTLQTGQNCNTLVASMSLYPLLH